jgi:Mg2+-importing ATPase
MFSVAGASLFLPFLPMLPTQILLNNLLYDFSQSTIPTDEVDQEYIEKPKRLDIRFIRRFMIFLGPVSSLFDFLTFFIMLFIFNAYESLFQTAWFIESLTSQTLVIFVIRTRKSPFWKSKPSKLLLLSSIAIVIFALVLPYTPLGEIFEFVRPPATFYIALAIILITYIILAEIIKNWFYKKYGHLIEQTLIPPKKIGIFKSHKPLSKNNK